MSDESTKRTELAELGEFGLIDHLTRDLKLINKSSLAGVGDDAAVIDAGDHVKLVTNDILIEGVHFDLTYVPLKHLGYKAAIVNFSDVMAMNATPKQLLVSIGVSNRFSVEAVEALYSGIRLACEIYQVDLVGGDTTSSPGGMFISVTAIGEALLEDITYRHGASANDLLCVSGDLGSAYLGLLILEREKAAFKANPDMQPDLEGMDYLLERQLKPEARKDILKLFKEKHFKPTSMIDVSDGLASEALHLCKQSKLGCMIYEDKIPMDPSMLTAADAFNIIPSIAALNGGEDYELLFTLRQDDYEKIKDVPEIRIIGYMTETTGAHYLITHDESQIELNAQGWNAFREKTGQPGT